MKYQEYKHKKETINYLYALLKEMTRFKIDFMVCIMHHDMLD